MHGQTNGSKHLSDEGPPDENKTVEEIAWDQSEAENTVLEKDSCPKAQISIATIGRRKNVWGQQGSRSSDQEHNIPRAY